ncbi:hypothetical protein, partial [Mucilaginibacter sp.]|uniref:hypothetical protein n=1 Tax=Mucilaginibacter sp. TaxID=1882438 RepID=UPI0026170329
KLHQALDKYNIGKLDGQLWKSLQEHIVKNNGDAQKVIIQFLQCGRFVDMGVGRGVPIGAAGTSAFSAARNANGTLKHYARKPKPWFSRAYYRESQRFAELFAKEFNKQIPVQIIEAMNTNITLAA